MSLLLRNYTVDTRYGGGFVQSIDGLAGGERRRPAGRLVLLRQRRRGARRARPPRTCTPATTSGGTSTTGARPRTCPRSSAPTPSRSCNGIARQAPAGARRMRVPSAHACRTVAARLRASACPPRSRALGSGGGPQTLRVLVGPWRGLARRRRRRRRIERGPRASGVYARFRARATTLTLLDQDGRAVRTLRRRRRADRRDAPGEDARRSGSSPAPTRAGVEARRAARSSEATLRTPLRASPSPPPGAQPLAGRRRRRRRAPSTQPARDRLPPPREPAARRARDRRGRLRRRARARGRCWSKTRSCSAALLAAVLLAAGRRRRRAPAARRAARAVALPMLGRDGARQRARQPRRADGVRAARRLGRARAGRT